MFTFWIIGVLIMYLAVSIFRHIKWTSSYWKEKGVAHVKPLLFFGNYFPVFTLKKNAYAIYHKIFVAGANKKAALKMFKFSPHLAVFEKIGGWLLTNLLEIIELGFRWFLSNQKPFQCLSVQRIAAKPLLYEYLYQEFPEERMVGVYEFTTPTVVIRDPELIEQILIRDFNSFPDHGPFIFEPSSSLYNGLFILAGERWRALRNKLLATFTTGRMKLIHSEIRFCCEELVANPPPKMDHYAFRNFAIKAFLRALFGSELRPEGEAEFIQAINVMFEAPLRRYVQQQFLVFFPRLGSFLNCKYVAKSVNDYIISILNTILNARENIGFERKDFTDVLIQLRKSKVLNIFNRENNKTDNIFDITNDLVLSQGFFFFFAGMDTTTLAMLYTAFELARNPRAQIKARAEVKEVLKKHGSFSYDAVREMKYMECCVQEALRIHPTVVFLMRIADRPTKLAGIQIDTGTRIIIPNFSLQMDPQYFPDPEEYIPERFDGNHNYNKFAHLPFSDGPRVCLGKKFSLIEIATLMGYLINHFELSVDPETKLPLEYHERAPFLTPKYPLSIRLANMN